MERLASSRLDGPSLRIFPFPVEDESSNEESEETEMELPSGEGPSQRRSERLSNRLSQRASTRRQPVYEVNVGRDGPEILVPTTSPTEALLLSLNTCPIYLEESDVARRRLWIHIILISLVILFSAVTFFTILNLYYRIPGKGTTCELTQQFTSAGLTEDSLQNTQGMSVFCQLPLTVSGIIITLLIPLACFPLLMLLRIIAYYQYSVGWSGFLFLLMFVLLMIQLASAILLLIGYIETCNIPSCERAFWSQANVALVGTIFAWLTLLPMVSLWHVYHMNLFFSIVIVYSFVQLLDFILLTFNLILIRKEVRKFHSDDSRVSLIQEAPTVTSEEKQLPSTSSLQDKPD